jgi:hypothetical protein
MRTVVIIQVSTDLLINSSSAVQFTIDFAAQSLTPTPTVPELPILVILPLFIPTFCIAVILRHQKTIAQNKPNA